MRKLQGVIKTKKGKMLDKRKLSDIDKFKRPKSEDPHAKPRNISIEDMVKKEVYGRDEDLGIF